MRFLSLLVLRPRVVLAGFILALGAGTASAGPSWSVGIDLPGVAVGVAQPAPVYYPAAPAYVVPAPTPRYEPRAYYAPPPPVAYAPVPVYVEPDRRYYRSDWEARRWERHERREQMRRDWERREYEGRRGGWGY